MKQIGIALFSMAVLIGCNSNTPKPDTIKIKQSQEDQSDHVQKESNGSYSIIVDGKTKYTNLKYAVLLDDNGSVEVLDANNRKKIVHIKPEGGCDMIAYPLEEKTYKIKKKGDETEVIMNLFLMDTVNKDIPIVSIPKNKANKIFFSNQKQILKVKYSDQCELDDYIFFQKSGRYGVLGRIVYRRGKPTFAPNSNTQMYDSISLQRYSPYIDMGCTLKVKRNGFVGYLGHTKIKYKSIGRYDKTLARFTLPDGRRGYVTTDGTEYYD